LAFLTCTAGLFSALMMWFIREPKTPRWLDFMTAVMLLIFSALYLATVTDLQSLIPNGGTAEKKLSTSYSIALLVVPFFTAGIATNILSHMVLAERDYDSTAPFTEVAIILLKLALFVLALLTVIPFVAYAGFMWARKQRRGGA